MFHNRRMAPLPHPLPQFCRYCGTALCRAPDVAVSAPLLCPALACMGASVNQQLGPQLLVLTFIFAENHLLLLRRGVDPYAGSWAPPGGYVEPYESAEAAAIRETWEEVGILLDSTLLVPLAISSLPAINQVYVAFLARLNSRSMPVPRAPEALDARWFPETAFPLGDIWAPSYEFDMQAVFARLRAGRFEFYQRTENFLRLISDGERITYLSTTDRNTDKAP
jgi:ADP-ribose pyrophosphatase YjhB (NUDIX family)